MNESVSTVLKILNEEIDILGDSTKVYLGGFSQGACVAFNTFIKFDKQLGGIAGFSGLNASVFDWSKVDLELKKKTPIMFYHGKDDMFISLGFARSSYAKLKSIGLDHFQFLTEPGLKHNFSPTGIARLA